MVKGMNLVRELRKDLKIANVICKNGRRNLTSSTNEASRDLIVYTNSKKKQALLVGFSICSTHLASTDRFFNLFTLIFFHALYFPAETPINMLKSLCTNLLCNILNTDRRFSTWKYFLRYISTV